MLVFDLDDTLYLERNYAISGYRHLERVIEQRYGLTGFSDACLQALDAGQRYVIDAALVAFDLVSETGLSAELIDMYRSHAPKISLEPDARRYLQASKATSHLGLITDGYERSQAAKIEALGLKSFIEHICITASLGEGKGKPHAAAYKQMESLASTSGLFCYVADNPAKDFVTPKKRGWLCIQIMRNGAIHPTEPRDQDHSAHARIDSLDELDAIIQKLS